MEDYLQYKSFQIQESISEEKIKELMTKFNSTPGINNIDWASQSVSVVYNPYEISEKEILKSLSVIGLIISIDDKKSFKNRLKKIAEENKKDFGGKRLDCCDMNN
jgi:allophanate hydrolase subunit 1